jgi:hypothetical protein
VGDRKPPRPVGDERETVLALWQFQRESVVRKVAGLSDADAARRLVASDTTLLWLVVHLSLAESLWIEHRFAGGDLVDPGAPTSIADAVAAYRATWARVDAVIAAAPSLDEPCATNDGESTVTLRWVLAHLLEETARHAGHADILRELIDGDTGR